MSTMRLLDARRCSGYIQVTAPQGTDELRRLLKKQTPEALAT